MRYLFIVCDGVIIISLEEGTLSDSGVAGVFPFCCFIVVVCSCLLFKNVQRRANKLYEL